MDQGYNSFEADKRRFRIQLVGILIALVLLAVAGWFSRSFYHHYKEKRNAAQAQAFLAAGDFRSAMLSARTALLLNPANVSACRVMATMADLSHSPAVLDWQREIVRLEPTVENKLQLAAAALRYQPPPFPITAQILGELAPAATNRSAYQVVAASLALSLHQLAAAETHFAIAAQLEPTNRQFELNLAIIRLGGTNAAKAVTARQQLKTFCTDTNFGPAALRALVVDRLAQSDLAAAHDFSNRLLASPQAGLGDHLQQLEILQQLKSPTFPARLQAVQQLAGTNAPAVAAVAAWMQTHQLLAESLNWLTHLPSNLQSTAPVRLAIADGYLRGKDWSKLRDFVTAGNWGDLDFLRLALVARAWSQLDVKPVADSNWGAAVTAADNRFSALTTLLGLAEQWQWPAQQEALLERIVAKFPQEHWAQQALEQTYFTAGKTMELYQLYARLFLLFPHENSIKNNLAATSLLLKTNVPQAGQWAAEVYVQTTNDPVIASTYAYALHLQGRDAEGLAVLQKLTPAQRADPAIALYYGLLLAATGKNAEAAPYFQIARTQGQLLPEEQQLLNAALVP
jgi:Flp pilus assembly protein TadD